MGLSDLAVGEPAGGELGHAPLAGRERVDAGEPDPARPGAGARSSVRAWSSSAVAAQALASSRPRRSGARASTRWLARRSAAPSSTSERASSSRDGDGSSTATDSFISAMPRLPPAISPARRSTMHRPRSQATAVRFPASFTLLVGRSARGRRVEADYFFFGPWACGGWGCLGLALPLALLVFKSPQAMIVPAARPLVGAATCTLTE